MAAGGCAGLDKVPRKMNQSLEVWLAIAKAPYPVTSAYVRVRVKSKTIAQTLGHMVRSGHIEKKIIMGKVTYKALESPSRLSMADIFAIAKARM